MLNKTAVLALILLVAAATAGADDPDPCPCPVLSYTWMATPCETWNCAAAALVLANGDARTIVLPTASEKFKWVVVKRIVGGSVIISPDAPFLVERFDSLIEGSARFAALDRTVSPMLFTATDGNVLPVYMRHNDAAKGRAVGH